MKNYILLIFLISIITFNTVIAEGNDPCLVSEKKINIGKKYILIPFIKSRFKDEPSNNPDPFFTLHIGAFLAYAQPNLRISFDNSGQSTSIDLKNDLGFKSKGYFPNADLYLRLDKRHQLVFSAFIINRHNTTTLNRNIQYGDTTYYANSSLNSKVNFTALSGDYRFSIIRTPIWELGLLVGAKYFNVHSRLNAELNQFSYTRSRRDFALIPLPGIHGSIYLSKHVLIRAVGEYLTLNNGTWKFKILQIRPSIEIYPIKNIGIGAAYDYFNTDISKVAGNKFNGNFKYIFNSVSLFASFRL